MELWNAVDKLASKMNEYFSNEDAQRELYPASHAISRHVEALRFFCFTQLPLVPSEPMAIMLQLMAQGRWL